MFKRNPWWRDIGWYLRHPFQWGGKEPCPYMYIGPWLVTWSRYETRPWWLSVRVSFMPD
jgi:hypothetical protein